MRKTKNVSDLILWAISFTDTG